MYINKRKDAYLIEKTFKNNRYNDYLHGEITFGEFCSENFCTEYVMQHFLQERKLQTRQKFIQSKIENSFFDIIDTEKKAYLLGFYFADGGILGNRLTVCVSKEDGEIVRLFRDTLSPNSKIHEGPSRVNKKTGYVSKECLRVSISSKHICEQLSKIGMGERKTYEANPIFSIIPDSMMSHFIRGYFDGDGCVCKVIAKRKHKTKTGEERTYEIENFNFNIISHKKEHLIELSNIMTRLYGITPSIFNDNKGCFLLEINRKADFFKMRSILYDNANFYLKRKKDKYYSIISTKVSLRRKVYKLIDGTNEVFKKYDSIVEASKDAGVTPTAIAQRIKKKITINGFRWEYANI